MSSKKRNLLFQTFILACSLLGIISQVFELTEVSFDLYTRDKDVMLVEFIMPWCRHCQALQPEWEKATRILAENREYVMGKVNCWESGKSLCDKLKIAMYPEIRLYRHGVYTETFEGERTAASILDFIQRAQATAGHVGPPATSSIMPLEAPSATQPVVMPPSILKPTMPPQPYPQYSPTPQPFPPAYPEIPGISYSAEPYQPPAQQPPVYQPPASQPPVYQPPAQQPPVYQPPAQQQFYPPKVQPPSYFPPPLPPRLPPLMRQVSQPYKPLAPPYLPPTPPKMVVTSDQFYTTPLSGAYQAPPGAINLPMQTISAKPDQELNFYETIVPPPPNSGSNFQVQEMPMANFQPPSIASAAAQRLGQPNFANGQFIPGRETQAFGAALQAPSLPNLESLYGTQRDGQGVPTDVYNQNGYETQQQYTANIPNAFNQMSLTTPIKPKYISPQTYRYTHNKASQLPQQKPMYYSYEGPAKNEQHVKDIAGPSLANYLASIQPASIPPAAQQYQQKYQTQIQQYNKQQQQQYNYPQTGAGKPHGSGPSDQFYNSKTLSNPSALFTSEGKQNYFLNQIPDGDSNLVNLIDKIPDQYFFLTDTTTNTNNDYEPLINAVDSDREKNTNLQESTLVSPPSLNVQTQFKSEVPPQSYLENKLLIPTLSESDPRERDEILPTLQEQQQNQVQEQTSLTNQEPYTILQQQQTVQQQQHLLLEQIKKYQETRIKGRETAQASEVAQGEELVRGGEAAQNNVEQFQDQIQTKQTQQEQEYQQGQQQQLTNLEKSSDFHEQQQQLQQNQQQQLQRQEQQQQLQQNQQQQLQQQRQEQEQQQQQNQQNQQQQLQPQRQEQDQQQQQQQLQQQRQEQFKKQFLNPIRFENKVTNVVPAQEKKFQDTFGFIHYSKKEDMPQANNVKVSYGQRLNQYLDSNNKKQTSYPKPAPLVYHFGNNTWPREKVKLKLSFEPSENGKYEMKVNGPFDVYGKKIPKVTKETRNEMKMKNVDYDHLSDEDKLKLSQQINREENMEDIRESYDSKYLPPTNRAYKSPPSFLKSDDIDGIRRPLVRVNIPRYANKSVILTNILPGSKKSLSIKLPVNVSLETVLKNIYNHMYEYYFHKTPSESNTKEEAAARKVIQELINKDMKNISNYVSTKSKASINNDESSNSFEATTLHGDPPEYVQPKLFETSTLQNDLPAYVRPNTIVEPSEENNLKLEPVQKMFSYTNASMIDQNSDYAEKENKIEQIKVEGSESISSSSESPSNQGILSPNDRDNFKDSDQGITRSSFPPYQDYQPYTIKLRGSLESNIKTLEYIHKNNLINNDNKDLVNSLLNVPLSAIAEEHYKKSTVGRVNMPGTFHPLTSGNKIQGALQLINNSMTENLQTINEFSKKSIHFEKPFQTVPLRKPNRSLNNIKDFIMPISNEASYFLIDTTGVSKNKPMVIETVAEYLKKKNKKPQTSQSIAKDSNLFHRMVSKEPLETYKTNGGTKSTFKTEYSNTNKHYYKPVKYPQLLTKQKIFFNKQQNVPSPLFNSHEIKSDSLSSNLLLNSKAASNYFDHLSSKSSIQATTITDPSLSAYMGNKNKDSYPINLHNVETEFLEDNSHRSNVNSVKTTTGKATVHKNEGDIIEESSNTGEKRVTALLNKDEAQRPFKNADEFFGSDSITEKNTLEDNERPSNSKTSKNHLYSDSARYKGSVYTLDEELKETERRNGKSNKDSESNDAQWDKKVFVPGSSDLLEPNSGSNYMRGSNDVSGFPDVAGLSSLPGEDNVIYKKSFIPPRPLFTNEQILDQRNRIMRRKLVLMKRDKILNKRMNKDDEFNMKNVSNINLALLKIKQGVDKIFKKNKKQMDPKIFKDFSIGRKLPIENEVNNWENLSKNKSRFSNLSNKTFYKYNHTKLNDTHKMTKNNILKDFSQVSENVVSNNNHENLTLDNNNHDNSSLSKYFNATQKNLKKRDIDENNKYKSERHTSVIRKKKKKTLKTFDNEKTIKKENSEFTNFTFNPKKNVSENLFDDSDMGQMLPMENEDYGLSASLEPEKKVIVKTSDITERVK